jgi:hypothetical protein
MQPVQEEDAMKCSTLVAAALLAVAATGSAQTAADRPYFAPAEKYQKADIRSLERSFLFSLGSSNDGVVESAIAHVARIKMEVPDASMERIKAALGCLSVNGRTSRIRYRAYLAGLVFDEPVLFAGDAGRIFSDADEFFTTVSGCLEGKLLGAIDRKYVRPE